jgi:spore coat polysaccharide biosynthesis protein SpsF (cytidylyltransferase family)
MKVVAIVQERMGSTRLPGKLLREVNRQPLIEILLHRLSKAKQIDQIVLATYINSENDNVTIDYHPH